MTTPTWFAKLIRDRIPDSWWIVTSLLSDTSQRYRMITSYYHRNSLIYFHFPIVLDDQFTADRGMTWAVNGEAGQASLVWLCPANTSMDSILQLFKERNCDCMYVQMPINVFIYLFFLFINSASVYGALSNILRNAVLIYNYCWKYDLFDLIFLLVYFTDH